MRCWLLLLLLGTLLPGFDIAVTANVPWADSTDPGVIHLTASCPVDADTILRVQHGAQGIEIPLRLKAGEEWRREVLLPASLMRWNSSPNVNWLNPDGSNGHSSDSPTLGESSAVALVGVPGADRKAWVVNRPSRRLGSSHSSSGPNEAAEIDPMHLPRLWQAYPPWLVLVFGPGAETRLDDGQREAIRCWLQHGGTLVSATPRLWPALPGVKSLPTSATDIEALRSTIETRLSSSQSFDQGTPNVSLPGYGAGEGTAPYAVLAILFALIAGPGQLWWAKRSGRRFLLVLTAPSLALAACVLLFTVDLLRFGLGTVRSAVAVTLVDGNQHHTWSGQTVFSTWSIGSLPAGDGDRWLLGLDRNYSFSNNGDTITLDWNAQVLRGDLVRGRRHEHLAHTGVRPDRRRLAVQRTGNGYALVNGLGVDLTSFRWRDHQGEWWSCGAAGNDRTTALEQRNGGMDSIPFDRLPDGLGRYWGTEHPGTWQAQLAQPLAPLPGLSASELVPVQSLAFGQVEVQP